MTWPKVVINIIINNGSQMSKKYQLMETSLGILVASLIEIDLPVQKI